MPERSWLTETEYTLDENLHTLEHQTIVLDLENSAGDRAMAGAGVRSNHHRLLVDEDRRFSFCIPVDEPHILRIKVRQ